MERLKHFRLLLPINLKQLLARLSTLRKKSNTIRKIFQPKPPHFHKFPARLTQR